MDGLESFGGKTSAFDTSWIEREPSASHSGGRFRSYGESWNGLGNGLTDRKRTPVCRVSLTIRRYEEVRNRNYIEKLVIWLGVMVVWFFAVMSNAHAGTVDEMQAVVADVTHGVCELHKEAGTIVYDCDYMVPPKLVFVPAEEFRKKSMDAGTIMWAAYYEGTIYLNASIIRKDARFVTSTIAHEASHHVLHVGAPGTPRCLDERLAFLVEEVAFGYEFNEAEFARVYGCPQ